MKFTALAPLAIAGLTSVSATPVEKRAQVKGIDVSSYQKGIDWAGQKRNGVVFAYIKATEGTGGWSADGKTLPGALDIEYNPSGPTCYGLSAATMTCTGNSAAFATSNALWIAKYTSSPAPLPAGWGYYTFWQYASKPIDQDYFNGDYNQLVKYARGG